MASSRKHVMLSYQWDIQELVIKVYDKLKEHNIDAWMDIRGGMCLPNMWQAMAEGVENAAALCCFLTPEYQASKNCLRELQRAAELNLLIIPCRLCADWKPSGSLGLLITGLMWIDFHDTAERPFEVAINKLIDYIQVHAYNDEPIYFPETRPYNRLQVAPQDVHSSSGSPQLRAGVSDASRFISNRSTHQSSGNEGTHASDDESNTTAPYRMDTRRPPLLTTPTTNSRDLIPEVSVPPPMFTDVEKRNLYFVDVLEEPDYLLLPIDGYQHTPLMSLDKAVEPIKHLFDHNIDAMVYIAKQRCQHPKDGLSTDESAAICLYTMEATVQENSLYYVLNNALRAEERRRLVPFFAYLKLVLTALWKLPSEKCIAWRGVNGNISGDFAVGKTIVWWGFSSCTTSMSVLQSSNYMNQSGTRTLFSIECMNGKIIRNHSYFKNEDEILLLPAIQLRVISQLSPAPQLHIIQLKEIEGPFPLLRAPFTWGVIPQVLMQSNPCDLSAADTSERTIACDIDASLHLRHSQSQPELRTQGDIICAVAPRPSQGLSQMLTSMRTTATVDLSNKQIYDDDLKVLSEALQSNCRCVSLSLSSNNLTNDGIKSLTLALRGQVNRTLKILILSSNNITDSSVQNISNMLKFNRILEMLDLSANNITDIGMKYLAEALKLNTTLKKLYLNQNMISDAGVQTLLQGLKRNRALELINLCDNQVTKELKQNFVEQLSKGNYTLKTVLL